LAFRDVRDRRFKAVGVVQPAFTAALRPPILPHFLVSQGTLALLESARALWLELMHHFFRVAPQRRHHDVDVLRPRAHACRKAAEGSHFRRPHNRYTRQNPKTPHNPSKPLHCRPMCRNVDSPSVRLTGTRRRVAQAQDWYGSPDRNNPYPWIVNLLFAHKIANLAKFFLLVRCSGGVPSVFPQNDRAGGLRRNASVSHTC
jgi:hypothetical protein